MFRRSIGLLLMCGAVILAWTIGSVLMIQTPQGKKFEPPLDLKQDVALREVSWNPVDSPSQKQRLEVSIDPFSRRIEWLWQWCDDGDLVASNFQTMAVPYVPTALCAGASYGEIYVGAATSKDITKVLRYRVIPPGYTGGTLGDGTVDSVEVVLFLDASSQDKYVYQALPNLGLPGHLFLEFWSSRRVYDLDVASGTLTQVTSLAPGGGGIVVPDLSYRQDVVYAREHQLSGYTYWFGNFSDPSSMPMGTPVLRDVDKDGRIDDVVLLTDANISAYGLDDPSLYVD